MLFSNKNETYEAQSTYLIEHFCKSTLISSLNKAIQLEMTLFNS